MVVHVRKDVLQTDVPFALPLDAFPLPLLQCRCRVCISDVMENLFGRRQGLVRTCFRRCFSQVAIRNTGIRNVMAMCGQLSVGLDCPVACGAVRPQEF